MELYLFNVQIRTQSLHFLRGFQQLVQKEWIEMFNEHEIQVLDELTSFSHIINLKHFTVHFCLNYLMWFVLSTSIVKISCLTIYVGKIKLVNSIRRGILYIDLVFFQLFISGSLESMNVDDLRSNTQYTGGYHHVRF